MGWLFGPDYGPQLARIEALAITLDRRTRRMSQQEQDLNAAMQELFVALDSGLARIEAKLGEIAPNTDLLDEIAALRAKTAEFNARVDADVPPPPA
jgi:DNA repair exonuclease SbcCD ATPase subunit